MVVHATGSAKVRPASNQDPAPCLGHVACACRAQAVSLNFHFAVEQRSRSFLRTFFGFNGTAGVWRRTAMEQAGGWNMESTVEDMDLSLRAYLNGWKFK